MSPCWDIFLLSLIQVMVVATEIDTGGIPAPTITINARCLCSVCHLYHRIKLEAFTAGIAKRWKDGEGTKLEIFFRFATLPRLRILHIPLKTALTSTFNNNDILNDILLGYSRKSSLLDNEILSIYETLDVVGGKYYTLQLAKNIGPNYKENMLFVLLKYGFVYKIWVHDPKYFALTTNPAYLHFLLEIFDSDKTENYYFNLLLSGGFLKNDNILACWNVAKNRTTFPKMRNYDNNPKVSEVHELNLSNDPCQINPDYSFLGCVRASERHKG